MPEYDGASRPVTSFVGGGFRFLPSIAFALVVIALMALGSVVVLFMYAVLCNAFLYHYNIGLGKLALATIQSAGHADQNARTAALEAWRFAVGSLAQRLAPSLQHGSVLLSIQGLIDLIIAGFIFWRLPKLAARTRFELGFRRPNFRDVRLAFGAAVTATVLSAIVGLLFEKVFHVSGQQKVVEILLKLKGVDIALAVFAAAVAAPLAEEFMFRAFIFNALKNYLRLPWAVGLSALIFALAHFELFAVPELMVPGIIFALVYQRTGSLATDVLTHGFFNSGAFIALFVFHQT